MNILVACEFSGVVREACRRRGHNAWSCDILSAEDGSRFHIQDDVRNHLGRAWDMLIAHPECTRLCNSGVRWLEERNLWGELEVAGKFFKLFRDCVHIPRRAVENPIPHRHARKWTGPYTQIIHPWQHGHREMKATCLWLHGLPSLVVSDNVGPPPKDKTERRKWTRVHHASPGPDRWKERSRTLPGIAAAMAEQWGAL